MTNQAKRAVLIALGAGIAMCLIPVARAQVPFPQNWPNAPTGGARVDVYPYGGQCWTVSPIGSLPPCQVSSASTPGYAPSFLCDGGGFPNQTAGGWGTCGKVTKPPQGTGPQGTFTLLTGDTQRPYKYMWEALNPPDYAPDTNKFPGADYYEIAVHETWGFQGLASASLFPNPTALRCGNAACPAVPNGMQWTGVVNPATGKPVYTPVWGVGQQNMNGGPVTTTLQSLGLFPTGTPKKVPAWSNNNFVATWPSISIRGKTGRPVVVKWTNEFPNNHVFCPHPEAADWPCAIDRTFMGVKDVIDPGRAPSTFASSNVPFNGVNQYGGPQQPDNSWVTHLHGGEIPPQTDGFAEKWIGNATTGALYSPTPQLLNPSFNAPFGALLNTQVGNQYGPVYRPGGTPNGNPYQSWKYDTYAYPMVNQESTIWFHDHTLGKTHHNVIAGPAGFFPVKDPSKHFPVVNGVCTGPQPDSCEYTWIDPITEPRDALGIPKYDFFFAVQDRDFNEDGTFNFPNGMMQIPAAAPISPAGYQAQPGNTPFVPGPNPQVHPVWVPEYFASNGLVNGVIWPKKSVEPGFYRIRFVDGSDARCYNVGFSTQNPIDASGNVTPESQITFIPFKVVANEQGYLRAPITATQVVMCPGERYEFVFDFTGYAGQSIYLVNDAPGPYPGGGNGPFDPGSPFPDLATLMRFDVVLPPSSTTVTSLAIPAIIDQDFVDLTGNSTPGGAPIPFCNGNLSTNGGKCIAAVRNLYLNERIDGVTGNSLGLQINGVPFEYDVTETPKQGTYELWNIINTTVDAHPIHPHLIKAQILGRQDFDVAGFRLALCQSFGASQSGQPPVYPIPGDPMWADNYAAPDNNCTAGSAPGGVIQLTPDPTPFLLGSRSPPAATEAGWKDVMRAMPGQVLTFVAKWDGSFKQSTQANLADVTAPGAGNPRFFNAGSNPQGIPPVPNASQWVYPSITSGPYVWHCHINSHEDSEMMRSSLVVK